MATEEPNISLMDLSPKQQVINAQKTKEEANSQKAHMSGGLSSYTLWLGIGLIIIFIVIVIFAIFILSDFDKLRTRVDGISTALSNVIDTMERTAELKQVQSIPLNPDKKITSDKSPQTENPKSVNEKHELKKDEKPEVDLDDPDPEDEIDIDSDHEEKKETEEKKKIEIKQKEPSKNKETEKK